MPKVQSKKFCVKNQKTRRCIRSAEKNETSDTCQFSNKTQRCKTKKNREYVPYNSYKVEKSVPSFLNKKIIHPPLAKLMSIAKQDPSYEDVAIHLFEKKNKTEADIKHGIAIELLDLAENVEKDREESDVISMKSIKYAIKQDNVFSFLRR